MHSIYCVVDVQEERAFPAGASGAIKRTAAAASTMRVCRLSLTLHSELPIESLTHPKPKPIHIPGAAKTMFACPLFVSPSLIPDIFLPRSQLSPEKEKLEKIPQGF